MFFGFQLGCLGPGNNDIGPSGLLSFLGKLEDARVKSNHSRCEVRYQQENIQRGATKSHQRWLMTKLTA